MISLLQITRVFSRAVAATQRQYATLAKRPQDASKLKPKHLHQRRELSDELLIHVDASVKDNLAGAGVYSDGVCKIRESVQLEDGLKSGEAEVRALILAIRIGVPLASQHGRRYVTICSDSQEALKAGEEYVRARKLERVRFIWVKGHSGILGNVRADQLAKSGRSV